MGLSKIVWLAWAKGESRMEWHKDYTSAEQLKTESNLSLIIFKITLWIKNILAFIGTNQCKITSAYEKPKSSGNHEVSQTHLAIPILIKHSEKLYLLIYFNNSVVTFKICRNSNKLSNTS